MVSEDYAYLPVSSEREDGFRITSRVQTYLGKCRTIRRDIAYTTFHLVLLLAYVSGALFFLKYTNFANQAHDASKDAFPYSPAHNAIRYVNIPFNAAPDLTSPYVGESRPSLDQAWHDLVKYTNMRISTEDLHAVNRTSIPLGKGGGFYGEMAVFHELHCVKFLRQAFHLSYYRDSFGEIEKQTMGEHFEHCIEILRQSVMCRGDTSLITFHWAETIKLPQPDFTLPHKCLDWDALMSWSSEHAIDVFEEGMLVHPTLGPSYPDGWRDDRPRPPKS